jgi:hypothetical protein
MSTFTPTLGLEEIAPGTQAGLWGDTTNNNLLLIDQAVTGVTPLSFSGVSGTTITLDDFNGAPSEARSAVLNITGGATGSNTVVIPNKQKTYLVRNDTGQNVVFQTPSPGATFTIGAGNSILIFCDGDNGVFTGIASPSVGTLGVAGGGTGATTFTAGFVKSPGGTGTLTSSAGVALGSEVSGILPVANGGTGAGTFTSGSLIVGNATSNFGVLVGGGVGQVATWNGSTWTAATPSSGGVTSLTAGTGISLSGATGAITITNTSTVNTTNPTFSSSVTSPVYNISGAASTYLQYDSSGVPGIGFVVGGVQATKITAAGIGTAGVIASTGVFDLQILRAEGAGFSSGLSPTSLQLGASGVGLIYSSLNARIEIALSGVRAYFQTSGNFQANNSPNWATVSDINIKTNLRPISSVLDKINALKPCHFEYKDKLGKVQTGFVAQEFATVFPGHTVDTPADDRYKKFLPEGEANLKAIDLNLTAYLVKAIQELSAKVTALEEQVLNLSVK